ncbi:MAG TPA: exosome complex exonuclease Rrp41 [Candidatus Nanoarchaeia archaeon]|nr:exosome complex exonuclease Rrp41 [Candidatus Nanoarchaeia archaeon]
MALQRANGRKADQLRPIKAQVGVVPNADGSAMFAFGDTVAIAAVYGPRLLHPQHLQNPSSGILRVNYDLLSFSVYDRKKPGPSRRSQEISKVTEWALLPVLDLKEFPNTVIDVQIYILQADAGTRTAGINAASLALAHAGIPMKNLVCSVALGRLDKDFVVDVDKEEEDFREGEGATDFPVAKIGQTDNYSLIQLDGNIPVDQVKKIFDLADKSCKEIYEAQKKALQESLS